MSSLLHTASKVHKSAVCLVPPRRIWHQIQEIRCFNDKSFVRWPPHVNLLYPFWEDSGDNFAAAAERCSGALKSFSNFKVKLASLKYFEHGRSCTLWVDPASDELCRLQAALVGAFPECTDLSLDPRRGISHFTPHLSLGQWRDAAAVEVAVRQLRAGWQPLEFEAGGVALISRQGYDDPFQLRYLIPFGGGPVQQLDLPYVATVGPPADSQGGDFGLGPWRDGIWNFAYGSNMCPTKLEGVRGLRPLESLPGQLPGWRLSFTHRGAMGNLVRAAPGEDSAPQAHGVLHRLSPSDWAKLANMEHEYRPEEVEVVRYDGQGTQRAIIFTTPEGRRIPEGLPTPDRYLKLLLEGSRYWGLDASYSQWLADLPTCDSRQRGAEFYTSSEGLPLPALPKIRTGSQQQQQQQHQKRQQQRDSGRGGRGGGRGRGQGRQVQGRGEHRAVELLG